MIPHKRSEPFKLVLKKWNYREDKLPKLWDVIIFPHNQDSTRIVVDIEEFTYYQETTLIVTLVEFKESKYKLINKIKILCLKLSIHSKSLAVFLKRITLKLISTIRSVSV